MDWLRVEGESMRPFLTPGDDIRVDWVGRGEPASFRLGELVLGRGAGNEWIVHRVVGRRPGAERADYLIKGDAAFAWDDFAPEEIWGRVVGIRRPAMRHAAGVRVAGIQLNALDRWIARFSRLTLPPHRLRARVARKIVFFLGYLRRSSL